MQENDSCSAKAIRQAKNRQDKDRDERWKGKEVAIERKNLQ